MSATLVWSTMLGTAEAYIALAFFMARISLAAASAAGDACFSGGAAAGAGCLAAGCWACSGAAATASPATSAAAAAMIFARYVIFRFSQELQPLRAVQQREFPARRPA